jgi:hypothetical protein
MAQRDIDDAQRGYEVMNQVYPAMDEALEAVRDP